MAPHQRRPIRQVGFHGQLLGPRDRWSRPRSTRSWPDTNTARPWRSLPPSSTSTGWPSPHSFAERTSVSVRLLKVLRRAGVAVRPRRGGPPPSRPQPDDHTGRHVWRGFSGPL